MRKRRAIKPRLPKEVLKFGYIQTSKIGEVLTNIPWYGMYVEVGWVWIGEEGWRVKEGEDRVVRMVVVNRLVVLRVEEEVTLYVGEEDDYV